MPAKTPAGSPKPSGVRRRQLIAAGRIGRPVACTLALPASVLAAYGYRSRAEAHADGVCARLFAIARRARTTGVVEMADHSINGDYGHEPIPTPPPTPPPTPSGSVTHTYAADDACLLCGWWRCRCGEAGSAVPQQLAVGHV